MKIEIHLISIVGWKKIFPFPKKLFLSTSLVGTVDYPLESSYCKHLSQNTPNKVSSLKPTS